MKIGILGDGGWGTTLAILLSGKGLKVSLWGPFPDYLEHLKVKRENDKFLPGFKIPRSVCFVADEKRLVEDADMLVIAIPSRFLRKVIRKIKKLGLKDKIVLSVTKGIENGTLMRMSEVIEDELGKLNLAVLSGPTIAVEVAKQIPTAAIVSSYQQDIAQEVQQIFSTDRFRLYTNPDLIGVELGGSLKNIIALACGISDGLGFGTNAKAALLARGLAEMTRLGIVMGAGVNTFSGLSGLGDLVTTCFSPYSRNRKVGEEIGKGRTLKEILKAMEMVAEGVWTVKSAHQLSDKFNVDMPITKQVYSVLYRRKNPLKAVNELMTRERKPE